MPLPLPKTREQIAEIQRQRKAIALQSARNSPFHARRLEHVDPYRLEDPAEWRKIPILEKEALRAMSDEEFYTQFCLPSPDGIAEYWRSGGSTGKPLFYPRSFLDMQFCMLSFQRSFPCIGLGHGERAHVSFPLGIHPAGSMYARAAQAEGITVNWAGAGSNTPSALQLQLMKALKPTMWMGMSSYGLHLANLAEAQGIDLTAGTVRTVLTTAEPLSDAKRAKLARMWGADVYDAFGMTECGLMGAEDGGGGGFRIWTDMFHIEVLDPDSKEPVPEGEPGLLIVTPLWTNHTTPFLRWNSGDLVTMRTGTGGHGAFSVFPLVQHAHRTAGFFKVRGVNLNHAEFEDFIFSIPEILDFKAEAVTSQDDRENLCLSVEIKREADAAKVMADLVERVKRTFELTPVPIQLENGTLAREFESSVKAPRFVDLRK